MRYGRDRPLWKQRRWWQDGLVFALAFPLVLTAVDAAGGAFGGAGPVPEGVLGYVIEVVAALGGWGLIGWAASLRREEE